MIGGLGVINLAIIIGQERLFKNAKKWQSKSSTAQSSQKNGNKIQIHKEIELVT